MNATELRLTKFDVAERQLNQAIALFFGGGDPVSIHTLAEAAAQVLYDIRSQHGGTSLTRDSNLIREEKKKEWLSYVFRSRNFFKHADRDANATHEFKDTFNHFSLLDATNLYLTAKKAWTPESLLYFSWFALSYPHLIKKGDEMAHLVEQWQRGANAIDADDFPTIEACLLELRTGRLKIPGLSLELGLPREG
jgi:hypothetical protein